jgi:hypothetical protein
MAASGSSIDEQLMKQESEQEKNLWARDLIWREFG